MRRLLTLALLAAFASPVLAAEEKDIVDTAVANGSFKTLVAAVKAADLVEVLKGDGPFTVLAPTDEAFAKLPEGTVESLLKPENKDKLIAILKYHVISGKAMASDVVKLGGKEVKTVQGESAQIKVARRQGNRRRREGRQDRRHRLQRRHPRHRHRDHSAVDEVSERPRPPARI